MVERLSDDRIPAITTRRVIFKQQGAANPGSVDSVARGRGAAAAPGSRSRTQHHKRRHGQSIPDGRLVTVSGTGAMVTPTVSSDAAIAKREVVDVTRRMRADGTLDWTPPPGRWRVLRFGWSLTGKLNSPASAEGTGLEVDKLNRDHVRAYIDTYLGLKRR